MGGIFEGTGCIENIIFMRGLIDAIFLNRGDYIEGDYIQRVFLEGQFWRKIIQVALLKRIKFNKLSRIVFVFSVIFEIRNLDSM